ncbi:MAG: site-specific DNA-methyltransferase, partial [Betaproteobacteria bacterium]
TQHHKQVPFRMLQPVAELSCGEAASPENENLIVQGDNLHALKALLPRYAGQVKCIYIDPPYNTGNEGWVYNDNVNSPEIKRWLGEVVGKEGETLDRHDRWLCMMYPRLLLLKQFLRDDGAIFVSIDDNEVASLRLLMDEIFGTGNFLANVVWQKRTSPDARLNLGPAHDHIVVYAKNLFQTKSGLHKVQLSDNRTKDFKNPDNDPRGVWASVDLTGQVGHATSEQFYEIITPSGKSLKPPINRCWALAERTFKALNTDGRIWFGINGNARPRQKRFLSEAEGTNTWTWWTNEEVGHNQEATKELLAVIDSDVSFETPKPTRLIQRILQIATDKDSLILDSFAGSGTTAHAILKQNAADGGNRRFILVEMDENIAQNVTAERVKRVAQGYHKANGEAVAGLGGSFKFCKLSPEPLFTAQGQIRADVTFAELAEFVWFTETGTGYAKALTPSPLLGVYKGKAIYLLFNGILKDRGDLGGNVLNNRTLAVLPVHDGQRVVYGARSRFDKTKLARMKLEFKQLPYELTVKSWV